MKFSVTSCKLESAQVEKDLGVIIDEMSGRSKKKANRMQGYIARGIEHKSKEVILTFCNTIVQGHPIMCHGGPRVRRFSFQPIATPADSIN